MKTRILLGVALLAPLVGWAADPVPMDLKLGLWESTVNTQMSGMPALPPEMLSKLTPEQRAKMEAAMGRGGGPRAITTKHCVTKETLSQALSFGGGNNEQNCKRTLVSSTGAKQVVHVECALAAITTSGDLQVEAINRENIKGSMVMNSGQGGRGMSTKMEFTSKWLGADCGDVGQKKK